MPEQFHFGSFPARKPRPKWFLRSVLRANPGARKGFLSRGGSHTAQRQFHKTSEDTNLAAPHVSR